MNAQIADEHYFMTNLSPPAVRQSAGRDKSGGSFKDARYKVPVPADFVEAAAPQLVKDLKEEELVLLKWYQLSPNAQKKAKKAGGEPNWNLVYSGRSIVLLLEAFFRGTAQEWERLKWNTDVFSLAPFKSSEWAEFVQQIHQAIENEEASPTAKQPSQQSAEEFGKAAFAAFHKEAQAVYPGMGAPPLAPAAAAAAGQATLAFGGVSATLTLQQAPEQAAAAATAEAKAAHASALSADFREALFFPLRTKVTALESVAALDALMGEKIDEWDKKYGEGKSGIKVGHSWRGARARRMAGVNAANAENARTAYQEIAPFIKRIRAAEPDKRDAVVEELQRELDAFDCDGKGKQLSFSQKRKKWCQKNADPRHQKQVQAAWKKRKQSAT